MIIDFLVRHQVFIGVVSGLFGLALIVLIRFGPVLVPLLAGLSWFDGFATTKDSSTFSTTVDRLTSRPRAVFVAASLGLLLVPIGIYEPIPKTVLLQPPAIEFIAPLAEGEVVAGGVDFRQQALIIFIHGWNGDPRTTWMKLPQLVKQDRRFASLGVMTLDYPTYIVRRNLEIPELAGWLLEHLRDATAEHSFQKVVVVAHSMGGLVAREMQIQTSLSGAPFPCVGMIEVATPHDGANPAGLAKALGISKSYARNMVKNSSYLRGLRQHWTLLAQRPKTVCLTSPHDRVVGMASATRDCDTPIHFPKWNHTEMVKPDDRDDDRYRIITRRVVEALER